MESEERRDDVGDMLERRQYEVIMQEGKKMSPLEQRAHRAAALRAERGGRNLSSKLAGVATVYYL